jgi:hypothetical protein
MTSRYSDLGGGDMSADNHAHVVTMLEAVRAATGHGQNISVSYNHGVHVGQLDTSGIPQAQSAANESDLAIVVVSGSVTECRARPAVCGHWCCVWGVVWLVLLSDNRAVGRCCASPIFLCSRLCR